MVGILCEDQAYDKNNKIVAKITKTAATIINIFRFIYNYFIGVLGFEPRVSRTRSERVTVTLYPEINHIWHLGQ